MGNKGRKTIGRFIASLYRMSAIYLGQELPALKIGAGQYIILAELFDEEGQSQDELTRKVYVDKANTARALNKLEKVGYVRRVADQNDQRIKRSFIEPKAQEIEEEFWQIITGWSKILTQNISPKRQDQLIKELKEMADNAAAYLERY
jgi:DNA-binding MarR family transcriptional regulator